jgi:hypothetical protein
MRFGEDSFSKKPGQEEEERIRGNQLALFGVRLRGKPERLRGGRYERWGRNPEASDFYVWFLWPDRSSAGQRFPEVF